MRSSKPLLSAPRYCTFRPRAPIYLVPRSAVSFSERRHKKCRDCHVTARGEVIDRVVGFEVGADDFVVKPFSVRELILRMRAILRRGTNEPESSIQETIEFGVLKLDPSSHRIWVAGEETKLTALEFRLVRTLLERKGRVQTRETLLIDVWEYEASVTTRTVDTHVRRLRQKLGAAGDYIETIRGVGYRFLENLES